MQFENSLEFAQNLDQQDAIKSLRNEFLIPQHKGKDCIYLTGNSLGLQSRNIRKYIDEELKTWATLGVDGHFHSEKRPWYDYHKFSKQALADLVGGIPSEVIAMNNLSSNLHFMMVSFYRPTSKRFKVIMEAGAFPSDMYAVESQIKFHNIDYEKALVEIAPREGEHTLRTEDIVECIKEHGDEVALVLFGGVQYYTGQLYDLEAIVSAGHSVGAFVGFDLAHAVGNVPLKLHDIGADFAAWCSYKYLNSGPGGVSGIFVHERHHNQPNIPRFAGWWGQDEQERFQMKKGFKPMPGADGWQLSNVNVISSAAHLAALEIFQRVGIKTLREKSIKLTGFMEFLLNDLRLEKESLEIITPENPEERGCQLSLLLKKNGRQVFDELTNEGVIVDWREPNVIRASPVPLYNTFSDVYHFVQIIKKSIIK